MNNQWRIFLFFTLLFSLIQLSAQNKSARIKNAINRYSQNSVQTPRDVATNNFDNSTEISQSLISALKEIEAGKQKAPVPGDLIIGDIPGEEQIISGNWDFTGDIYVIGDGKLRFSNATAVIIGNIYGMGNSLIEIDHSDLSFPQYYFYQRLWLISENCEMFLRHSKVNFGGMVHNMVIAGNARFVVKDAENPDFTTSVVSNHAIVDIDSIDVAGEFVITDQAQLSFTHASNLLLWHHFPQGAIVNHHFPEGDSLLHYEFSSATPGISGINYSILVDSSTQVMWGLMPEQGTNVNISDSRLRTVGVWFRGIDTSQVSGLVNYSSYNDFTAAFSDRHLHFTNCSLQTWSLYLFDSVTVLLSGSIVGEVGLMGHSHFEGQNYWVDGSGGYIFANDTATLVSGFANHTCNVRSEDDAIMIIGQSSQSIGKCAALGESLMMILQSDINGDPLLYDSSGIWLAYIDDPANAYTDTLVDITGSSWIDNSINSSWPRFSGFLLEYQAENATTWNTLDTIQSEKRKELLFSWNTSGLTPGAYLIRMRLFDDSHDTVSVFRRIILLPRILGIDDTPTNSPGIFPNPVRKGDIIYLSENGQMKTDSFLFSADGKKHDVWITGKGILIPSNIQAGTYYLWLYNTTRPRAFKVIITD